MPHSNLEPMYSHSKQAKSSPQKPLDAHYSHGGMGGMNSINQNYINSYGRGGYQMNAGYPPGYNHLHMTPPTNAYYLPQQTAYAPPQQPTYTTHQAQSMYPHHLSPTQMPMPQPVRVHSNNIYGKHNSFSSK